MFITTEPHSDNTSWGAVGVQFSCYEQSASPDIEGSSPPLTKFNYLDYWINSWELIIFGDYDESSAGKNENAHLTKCAKITEFPQIGNRRDEATTWRERKIDMDLHDELRHHMVHMSSVWAALQRGSDGIGLDKGTDGRACMIIDDLGTVVRNNIQCQQRQAQ